MLTKSNKEILQPDDMAKPDESSLDLNCSPERTAASVPDNIQMNIDMKTWLFNQEPPPSPPLITTEGRDLNGVTSKRDSSDHHFNQEENENMFRQHRHQQCQQEQLRRALAPSADEESQVQIQGQGQGQAQVASSEPAWHMSNSTQMDASNSSTTGTTEKSEKRKRNSESAEDDEAGSGTRYECRFCPMKFSKSQALGGHMNRHRQEREREQLQQAEALVINKMHQGGGLSSYFNNTGPSLAKFGTRSSSLPSALPSQSQSGIYHSSALGWNQGTLTDHNMCGYGKSDEWYAGGRSTSSVYANQLTASNIASYITPTSQAQGQASVRNLSHDHLLGMSYETKTGQSQSPSSSQLFPTEQQPNAAGILASSVHRTGNTGTFTQTRHGATAGSRFNPSFQTSYPVQFFGGDYGGEHFNLQAGAVAGPSSSSIAGMGTFVSTPIDTKNSSEFDNLSWLYSQQKQTPLSNSADDFGLSLASDTMAGVAETRMGATPSQGMVSGTGLGPLSMAGENSGRQRERLNTGIIGADSSSLSFGINEIDSKYNPGLPKQDP